MAHEDSTPTTTAEHPTAPAAGDAADPTVAVVGQEAVDQDEQTRRLADLTELIELIRPAVQADGGDLVLLSVDVLTGVIEVQLQGSCSSCAISSTTLQAGVERILKERLDWVTEVFGSVDEDIDWETSSAMGRGGYTPGW
jgi:Fe-S cluster biogenesis protein NfuA